MVFTRSGARSRLAGLRLGSSARAAVFFAAGFWVDCFFAGDFFAAFFVGLGGIFAIVPRFYE